MGATLALASGCGAGTGPSGPVTAASSASPSSAITRPSTPSISGLRLVVLGDSNAHPSSCVPQCDVFAETVATALGKALRHDVTAVNLAWELSNPHPAAVADILNLVKQDTGVRRALSEASAVVIFVSQNDLAYNREDDPCNVAPNYPSIRWDKLTHECMDAAVADYARDLDGLLDEIDTLRAGQPTMLRVVTAVNTTPGDEVDPTWDSPSAIEPSAYNTTHMAKVQCRLAVEHGGKCADILPVFNGADGKGSAQRYLNPLDATHLTQQGHNTVADVIIRLGFDPLTG